MLSEDQPQWEQECRALQAQHGYDFTDVAELANYVPQLLQEIDALRADIAFRAKVERTEVEGITQTLVSVLSARKKENMDAYMAMGQDHELSGNPSAAMMEIMIIAQELGLDITTI